MVRLQVVFALMVLGVSPAFSQLPQVVESRLGVDSVKIDGGKRLYGFLLSHRTDQSIVFSVGRHWLEATHPQLYAEFTGIERDRFEKLRHKRIERIEGWIENRPEDRGLVSFLEHELARFSESATGTGPLTHQWHSACSPNARGRGPGSRECTDTPRCARLCHHAPRGRCDLPGLGDAVRLRPHTVERDGGLTRLQQRRLGAGGRGVRRTG